MFFGKHASCDLTSSPHRLSTYAAVSRDRVFLSVADDLKELPGRPIKV